MTYAIDLTPLVDAGLRHFVAWDRWWKRVSAVWHDRKNQYVPIGQQSTAQFIEAKKP